MDPRKIISVKLTLEKIRETAEEFRGEHVFDNSLPVDIEHVIEAKMICNKFDVSADVIERRLRKENVMGLFGK